MARLDQSVNPRATWSLGLLHVLVLVAKDGQAVAMVRCFVRIFVARIFCTFAPIFKLTHYQK
jgi:hypothetical protein